MGVSVASIKTTSKTWPLAATALRPGNRKVLLRASVCLLSHFRLAGNRPRAPRHQSGAEYRGRHKPAKPEVQTAEGKLYLYVAIDRTSKFAFVQLVKKTGRHACVRLSGNSHRGYPLQNPYGAHQQWHPVHLPPTLRGRSNGEIHDACVRHVLPAIELGILPIEDESGYYPKHRNGGHARCIQPRRQTPTQVHHLRQRHRVRPAWATQNRARYGDLANRKRPRITPFLVSIWLL
jgi:hypothetical protein